MRLTGDKVMVRPIAHATMTDGGLYLPDTAGQQSEVAGEVIAVGEGPRTKNGMLLPHNALIGQTVFFSPYSGVEIDLNGERVFVLREDDILAVMDEEQED